jgi:hypothetical protein
MRGKETGKKLDEVTVDQFGHFYNRHVQPVTFFGYPDCEKAGDIDGLWDHIAVTHTSFDSIPDQRREWHHYKEVVNAARISGDDDLEPALNVVLPMDSLRTRKRWEDVGRQLRSEVMRVLPSISAQRRAVELHIAGFDQPVNVYIAGSRKKGISFYSSYDDTFREDLAARLRRQIIGGGGVGHDKLTALENYRRTGRKCLLLLESIDIGLMNGGDAANATKDALKGHLHRLDEVWFVHRDDDVRFSLYNFTAGDVWVYNHVNVEGELRLRGTGPAVPAEMP